MTILLYLGIAAVLFIVGILFILKGLPSEEVKAVPISNPHEIRQLKESFVPPRQNETPVKRDDEPTIAPDTAESDSSLENHQLRKEVLDERTKSTELELRFGALQKEYEQAKQEHQQALRILQEENIRHRAEMEQKAQNDQRLNELLTKTEILERQHAQSQKQQEEMRAAVEQLKVERDSLIARAQKHASPIDSPPSKEANRAEFELLSNKLIESIAALEDLKRVNKDLVKENDRLTAEYEKIKAMNDQIMKKEKMLQYELTKNRAQAMGLEKICADFRTQIETMAGSVPGKH